MSLLIEPGDLAGTPGSLRFIGAEHDDVPVSLFLVSSPPGEGPELHRHPYPEIFIVHAGRAEFQLDDARVEARAGNILIAPAGVPHRFTSVGSDELRLTAIHTAAQMETEWLESTSSRPAAAAAAAAAMGDRMLTDLGSALSGLSGSLGYEQSLRDYFTALLAAHGGERAAPA